MKILALELSSGRGSIAWFEGDGEPFEQSFANDRKHSGAFYANLQDYLQRFGRPELILVGLGPGSYAGTRIAIAAAAGLQAATGAQLAGVSSLRCFQCEDGQYCVIGDARRNSFFFAHVAKHECVEGPLLCTGVELRRRLATSRHPVFVSEKLADAPDAVLAYPSARVLARISIDAESAAPPLEPIYLREPHITQPKSREMLNVRL